VVVIDKQLMLVQDIRKRILGRKKTQGIFQSKLLRGRCLKHLDWLKDTKERLKTVDGKIVQVLEFRYQKDDGILSDWAKHFRNHYCSDSEIDSLIRGTKYTRAEYLNRIKFPDASTKPGPSIRAGDFGEVLIADYLEYILKYWVPRTRYNDKAIRNESTKGCDIIGFKILNEEKDSTKDTMAIFESKARFTGSKPQNRLQDAVIDSVKDVTRKAESLNFIKQKLIDRQQIKDVPRVERFQNPEDRPYREIPGAVALFSTECYDANCVSETDASIHPNARNLMLIVIHGNDMMKLVNELYRRAADEA